MGDGEPLTSMDLNLDGTKTRKELEDRARRLALPAVALSEWCALHRYDPTTAKGWANRGLFPPGAVWKSGRDWLIRPMEPAPDVKPGPKPK